MHFQTKRSYFIFILNVKQQKNQLCIYLNYIYKVGYTYYILSCFYSLLEDLERH